MHDAVSSWAESTNMIVDPKKSSLQIFGRDPGATETFVRPAAERLGCPLSFVQESRYPGVWLDSKLNWNFQVRKLCEKVRRRLCCLHKLSGAWFGPKMKHMRMFYLAVVESCLCFGASAYMSSLNSQQLAEINNLVASGCSSTLGVSRGHNRLALTSETGFLLAGEIAARESLRMYARAWSKPPDSPLRKVACESGAAGGWVAAGKTALYAAGLSEDVVNAEFPRLPVGGNLADLIAAGNVTLVKQDISIGVDRVTSQYDHVYWSDGSHKVKKGHRAGAAFARELPGGALSGHCFALGAARDSYAAEQAAVLGAFLDASESTSEGDSIAFVTDGLSVMQALETPAQYGGLPRNSLLRRELCVLAADRRVSVIFTRGHCGVPGNEAVDHLAGAATKLTMPTRVISGLNVREILRLHDRCAAKIRIDDMTSAAENSSTCSNLVSLWDKEKMYKMSPREYISNPCIFGSDEDISRADERLYSLLRLDRWDLGRYVTPGLHAIGPWGKPLTCPHCRSAPFSAQHVLPRCHSGGSVAFPRDQLHSRASAALRAVSQIRSEGHVLLPGFYM
jgi:ribonuclease HI